MSLGIDYSKGYLIADTKADRITLGTIDYIKTKDSKGYHLWRYNRAKSSDHVTHYDKIDPLGNNGEAIEMSLEPIKKSYKSTNDVVEKDTPSDLASQGLGEYEASNVRLQAPISDAEKTRRYEEAVDLIMKQVPSLSKEEAQKRFEDVKSNPRIAKKFIQNVFKQKGLHLNEEEALKEFEKYC